MSVDFDKLRIDEKQHAVQKSSRVIIAGIACFIIGLSIGLLVKLQGSSGQAVKVKTTVVRAGGGQTVKAFSAGGWIEVAAPQYPVYISAQISQRLQKLNVRQGDWVEPGQLIASLYDEDAKTRLRLADARAREQDEKLRIANAVCERSRELDKGAISAEELDRNLSELTMAREAAAAAAAEAELMSKELSYCTVSMPEGLPRLKVLNVFHSPGSFITMDKAAIVSLYDPSNIQVRVDVAQPNIKFVKIGADAEVRTEVNAQKAYAGTVLRIEPQAELAKNTVTVRIKINDPDEMLFPDMVANINFLAERSQGKAGQTQLMVPSDAVISDADSKYVFVCDKNIARRQKVEVGRVSGQTTIIKSGLTGGQRVIISELDKLSDGARVEGD
jgi:RND family efflux transporter MFP subunit